MINNKARARTRARAKKKGQGKGQGKKKGPGQEPGQGKGQSWGQGQDKKKGATSHETAPFQFQASKRPNYELIESKNSWLVLVPFILESKNSIESMTLSG